MKKKLLALTPVLLALLAAGCSVSSDTGGSSGGTTPPSSQASSEGSTSSESASGQATSSESSTSQTPSSEPPVSTKYTVTFDSRGGSSVTSVEVDKGSAVNEPTKPTYDGHVFVAWSYDQAGSQKVTWPMTPDKNVTLYANWNETVNIKALLSSLISARNYSPYSYIPDTMRNTYEDNHVTRSAVTYDFNNTTNISSVKYGGFGEQWNMVMENIDESQRFYSVLTGADTLINASVVLFNNYLDENPSDTADHELNETNYTAKIDYHNKLLKYSLRYKTGFNIPFFGEVTPQIDMSYSLTSGVKAVRIQLTENNALKYEVTENSYVFGIEYGVTAVSRKAYFTLDRDEDSGDVEGHIYEYVQYKDKDLVPACADFYIKGNYASVVGNKASGIIGFNDYIDELYNVNTGKLLAYKIKESKTISALSVEFNTYWFNMNNITGINSIKYIDNDHKVEDSDVGFYVNGSATKFAPKLYGGLSKKTASRRFDIEFRKQYFYAVEEEQLVELETEVPMMFVQEEKLSEFADDVASTNTGLSVSLNLATTYLNRLDQDYEDLIQTFIGNKGMYDTSYIAEYIGQAEEI